MLFAFVSIDVGSYGAMMGAKIAQNAASAMTPMPSIAALFRRSRHQASCQSERCLRARRFASIERCWAALVVTVAIYLPTLMRGSRIPYTMSTVMFATMIKNAYSKVVAMMTG